MPTEDYLSEKLTTLKNTEQILVIISNIKIIGSLSKSQ